MCKILLSINPQHVDNIFNGTKKYEYRKIKCKKEVDKIIIYSTYPVKKIVGEASVEKILEKNPKEIWEETKKFSGISLNFFEDYYKGCEKAIAYKLKNVIKYEEPQELKSYGIKAAPQSFVYV